MIPNSSPPERDIELLSAHLDNQLSTAEKARLERRLADEASLRLVLADLRWTRAALRSLPQIEVPRNFTLDPKTYATRRHSSLAFPTLRLATALASIVFALVLGADLVSRFPFGAQGLAQPAPQSPRGETTQIAESVALPSAAPTSTEAPALAAVQNQKATPASDLALGAGEAPAATSGTPALERAQPRLPASTQAEAPSAAAAAATASPSALEPTATSVSAAVVAQPTAAQLIPRAVARPVSPLRVTEIGLGLVALLLGAASLLARRR